MSPRPDICIIMNAGSGKRRGEEIWRELRAGLARHPGRFELREISHGQDVAPAARRAVEEGFAAIVAAGGDGTISGVAGEVTGAEARLGVLPLGTFNYFSRAYEIPDETPAALDTIIAGATRAIDVGEVNGKIFLNNASLGLYPEILARREDIYRRWGRSRLAAYWSVAASLVRFRRPIALRVTIDGAVFRYRTPLVFVAANARQLQELGLPGGECIADNHFAVFIAPDCSRLELLAYAFRLARQKLVPSRDFELHCGREILVETRRRRASVAHDGERTRLSAPFRFRMRRGALEVIVPAPIATAATAPAPAAPAPTAPD